MPRGYGRRRKRRCVNSRVGMSDVKNTVEVVNVIKKLAIPVAAAVAADVKNPNGFLHRLISSAKNKIPFKVYSKPEEIETVMNEPIEDTKKLPPVKIESSSKPIE